MTSRQLTWPRISPPGKSPGPVFAGGTPSFVCTLTYVSPDLSAATTAIHVGPTAGVAGIGRRNRPLGENAVEATASGCTDEESHSDRAVDPVGFTNSIALEIGQIHAPDRIYEPYGFAH
jgi:hypothetical protein